MTRRSWVFINGEMIPKEDYHDPGPTHRGVMPDLPDFVSPIDGKSYSGRTGMREHNARHNVVPTADLSGLPVRSMNQPLQLSKQEKAVRKEALIHAVNTHWKS